MVSISRILKEEKTPQSPLESWARTRQYNKLSERGEVKE